MIQIQAVFGPAGRIAQVLNQTPLRSMPKNLQPEEVISNLLLTCCDWRIYYNNASEEERAEWEYYDRLFRAHRALLDGRPFWLEEEEIDPAAMWDLFTNRLSRQAWVCRDDCTGIYFFYDGYVN